VRGYKSLHPWQEKRLRSLGVTDGQVTQGIGSAKASAGTHAPRGAFDGRRWGHCIDLDVDLASRAFFDRACEAGFLVFVRTGERWRGNEHIHAVDVSRLESDGGGIPEMLPLVASQVVDWTHGKNGLVGHGTLPDAWSPTQDQREDIRRVVSGHEGIKPVAVTYHGRDIPCYAYLFEGSVRCELRPLAEALGAIVMGSGEGLWLQVGNAYHGKVGAWKVRKEGSFLRCSVRAVAEALGHSVDATQMSAGRIVLT